MKIMIIVGNQPRHLYYANEIIKSFPNHISGVIVQERGQMIPPPPVHLRNKEILLWNKHFNNRYIKEVQYFGYQQINKNVDVLHVEKTNLESNSTIRFVKKRNPDIVLIFGCGLIRHKLAEVLPEYSINLHLGLSPRYRGAATLFWPFYFLEPQFAGCTFHKIINEPDAGDILHQCVPQLARDDGIHDVACKAVITATDEMVFLLNIVNQWSFVPQKSTGKNFLASDFKAQHLSMIYQVYNDDIVDYYLDGKLPGRVPKLVQMI